MPIRRTALGGATAAVALVLLAPAGAALADSYATDDARGDVVKAAGREGTGPDPTRVEGDIVRFNLSHGANLVNLTLRFAELDSPGANMRSVFTFALRASDGHQYQSSIFVDQSDPQGSPGFSRDGEGTSCDGLRSRIDYARNVVTETIPRSCLGTPRWLKGGASSVTGDVPAPVPGTASYLDDVSLGANGPVGARVFSSPAG